MSANGWWVRSTAASPSTAERPIDDSQRGLVPKAEVRGSGKRLSNSPMHRMPRWKGGAGHRAAASGSDTIYDPTTFVEWPVSPDVVLRSILQYPTHCGCRLATVTPSRRRTHRRQFRDQFRRGIGALLSEIGRAHV